MAGELSEFFTNIRAWDYLKNENRAFWQSAGTLCFFRCGYSPDLLAALQENPGQPTPFFASVATLAVLAVLANRILLVLGISEIRCKTRLFHKSH